MDATTSSLDPDRAKQNFSRQLDHLLAPLMRTCRFPVPPPAHLQAPDAASAEASLESSPLVDTNRLAFASTSRPPKASASAVRAPAPTEEERTAEKTKWANVAAYRTCAQQVPGLSRLEDRLSEGRSAGAECERSLQQLLTSLGSMREVAKSVQSQSEHLNQNASALLLRKTRLEKVRDELERTIQHFTHIEDLVREAEDPMLSTTSSRFPSLTEDLNAEMTFLVRHASFKSAPVYAANVVRAQQRLTWSLRAALRTAMQSAARTTTQSDDYRRAKAPNAVSASPLRITASPAGEDAQGMDVDASALDEAGRFAATLDAVNAVFVRALDDSVPLRRLAELLVGTTQSAAVEAFGAGIVPRGSLSREGFLTDVLNAYRDARVVVVCPLLRAWVVASCAPGAMQITDGAATPALMTPPATRSVSALTASGAGGASPSSPPEAPPIDGDLLPHEDSAASLPPRGDVRSPKSAALLGASTSVRSSSFAGALMSESFTLPFLAGHLCALMDVCLEGERDVLEQVWLREDVATAVLPKLVGEVTEEVYHAFRSRLLRVDGISELAETIQSIQSVPYSVERERSQVQEISDLWQRMIQDTQERMIFRTSVFIRQDIGRARPSPEMIAEYVRLATLPQPQQPLQGDALAVVLARDGATTTTSIRFIPAVVNTVTLLKCLYPTLEFSVFSTFAEEAIHLSLGHLQDLARLVNEQDKRTTGRAQPFLGYACQVAHLLFLRVELSRIDANIVVVEKKLDFAALRRTRLSVIQSSRESKKDVDGELVTASDRLIQCMLSTVSLPLEGAARKNATEAEEAARRADAVLEQCEYAVHALIPPMADGTVPAEELLAPVRQHLNELLATIATTQVQGLTRRREGNGGVAQPTVVVEEVTDAEPVAGSLEEAARTATALAAASTPVASSTQYAQQPPSPPQGPDAQYEEL